MLTNIRNSIITHFALEEAAVYTLGIIREQWLSGSPLLSALLSPIDQPDFDVFPIEQTYELLVLSDGRVRTETVELRAADTPDEELHVEGKLCEPFLAGDVETTYEAGRNGYLAK